MLLVCVRTGWAYPWAVRIRLCDLMLRGMFDTLDEASYVESKDALLQLLQTRVWPLLGISQHIHNTIYAWIHFRQFAVTGEPFQNERMILKTTRGRLAECSCHSLGLFLQKHAHSYKDPGLSLG